MLVIQTLFYMFTPEEIRLLRTTRQVKQETIAKKHYKTEVLRTGKSWKPAT